jgi:hypothetical protein
VGIQIAHEHADVSQIVELIKGAVQMFKRGGYAFVAVGGGTLARPGWRIHKRYGAVNCGMHDWCGHLRP